VTAIGQKGVCNVYVYTIYMYLCYPYIYNNHSKTDSLVLKH